MLRFLSLLVVSLLLAVKVSKMQHVHKTMSISPYIICIEYKLGMSHLTVTFPTFCMTLSQNSLISKSIQTQP